MGVIQIHAASMLYVKTQMDFIPALAMKGLQEME